MPIRLTDAQRAVLERLYKDEPPDNQPLQSETYTVDALLRRGLVKEGSSHTFELTQEGFDAIHGE